MGWSTGRDGRAGNFLSSISPAPLLAILCLVALLVGCLFGNAKPCDVTLRGSYGGLDGKHVASLEGTQVLVMFTHLHLPMARTLPPWKAKVRFSNPFANYKSKHSVSLVVVGT